MLVALVSQHIGKTTGAVPALLIDSGCTCTLERHYS